MERCERTNERAKQPLEHNAGISASRSLNDSEHFIEDDSILNELSVRKVLVPAGGRQPLEGKRRRPECQVAAWFRDQSIDMLQVARQGMDGGGHGGHTRDARRSYRGR
jgi:hypothetical protein